MHIGKRKSHIKPKLSGDEDEKAEEEKRCLEVRTRIDEKESNPFPTEEASQTESTPKVKNFIHPLS